MGHVGRAKGHIRGLRIACPRSRTQAGSMEREICVQDHDRPLRTRSAQPDLSSAPRAAAPVLVLQRQAGNHAVARLLHAGTGDHSAARPVGGQHLGLQRQADPEYVPDLGAPEHKPLPETKPEVLGRKDLDEILLKNTRLRTRIVSVATELDIDPGMLAASLFAEKGASAWSGTSGTVASEALGLDDWFGADVKPRLIRIINAHPGLGLRFDDVKATGETWDTSTEKAGGAEKPRGELDADKAVAAFGVYFKMQESVLQGRDREQGEGPSDFSCAHPRRSDSGAALHGPQGGTECRRRNGDEAVPAARPRWRHPAQGQDNPRSEERRSDGSAPRRASDPSRPGDLRTSVRRLPTCAGGDHR
jgi:hypothetical protein